MFSSVRHFLVLEGDHPVFDASEDVSLSPHYSTTYSWLSPNVQIPSTASTETGVMTCGGGHFNGSWVTAFQECFFYDVQSRVAVPKANIQERRSFAAMVRVAPDNLWITGGCDYNGLSKFEPKWAMMFRISKVITSV